MLLGYCSAPARCLTCRRSVGGSQAAPGGCTALGRAAAAECRGCSSASGPAGWSAPRPVDKIGKEKTSASHWTDVDPLAASSNTQSDKHKKYI